MGGRCGEDAGRLFVVKPRRRKPERRKGALGLGDRGTLVAGLFGGLGVGKSSLVKVWSNGWRLCSLIIRVVVLGSALFGRLGLGKSSLVKVGAARQLAAAALYCGLCVISVHAGGWAVWRAVGGQEQPGQGAAGADDIAISFVCKHSSEVLDKQMQFELGSGHEGCLLGHQVTEVNQVT